MNNATFAAPNLKADHYVAGSRTKYVRLIYFVHLCYLEKMVACLLLFMSIRLCCDVNPNKSLIIYQGK